MSLGGDGVLAIWCTVASADLAEFRSWHNGEHFPERVAIPGIVEARRYRSLDRPAAFLTLYTLEDVTLLQGAPYRAVLRSPSPATVRNVRRPDADLARAACRIGASAGRGRGGQIAVWRHDADQPLVEAITEQWRAAVTDAGRDSAFACAHLLVAEPQSVTDDPATALLGTVACPRLVLIAESWTDMAQTALACQRLSQSALNGRAPEFFAIEAMLDAAGSGR